MVDGVLVADAWISAQAAAAIATIRQRRHGRDPSDRPADRLRHGRHPIVDDHRRSAGDQRRQFVLIFQRIPQRDQTAHRVTDQHHRDVRMPAPGMDRQDV